jgi:hypothetical protein
MGQARRLEYGKQTKAIVVLDDFGRPKAACANVD